MTTSELFLYARDRLEKEWYDTPECDQMRQAYEELIKRIAACIIRVCFESTNNERRVEHDDKN